MHIEVVQTWAEVQAVFDRLTRDWRGHWRLHSVVSHGDSLAIIYSR